MVFILILIPYNIVYRQMVEKCLVVMLNYPVDGAKPSRSQGSKISPKKFRGAFGNKYCFWDGRSQNYNFFVRKEVIKITKAKK